MENALPVDGFEKIQPLAIRVDQRADIAILCSIGATVARQRSTIPDIVIDRIEGESPRCSPRTNDAMHSNMGTSTA